MTDGPSSELLALMEHEKPIEDPTASTDDVVWSLGKIYRDELYRAAGYDSFDAYLAGRWGARP